MELQGMDKLLLLSARAKGDANTASIGDLTTLETAQKTTVVGAVNELVGQVDTAQENISKLQNEIRNTEDVLLQMNPNGDAKITVTSFDTVNALPKNAAQAGLGVVQEGMTATNLPTNGDFSDGTTGWTFSSGMSRSVSNNELTFTAIAQNNRVSQNFASIGGNVYYYSALVKADSALVLCYIIGTNELKTFHSGSGKYERLSGVGTLNDSTTAAFRIQDNRASGWSPVSVKGAQLINLTAIAKEAATLSQADAMLLDYFSGTQSAVTGRVRSVGKNLFDKNDNVTFGSILRVSNGVPDTSALYCYSNYIPVKPSTNYRVSHNVNSGIYGHIFYDKSKNFIGGVLSNAIMTFTTPANTAYIRVSFGITTLDTFQLELGTTATAYEPYRKTESYTKPMPLRRVPNATLDDVTNGKHTKRVSEWANVTGASFASIDNATYTNVSVVKTTAFALATAGTTAVDGSVIYRDKNGVVLAEVAQADIDNVASVGKFYYHTDKTVWRILAKGSDDIATARTALGTETMIYQLATPVITENVSSGTLLAYPSGTVYWDPVVADVAIYATGASILNTGYPISSLESIYKIDLVTGEQTPLDVASATIASGGLSFTHTGLVDGDLVGFTYYFDHPYPYGENDYMYYDDRLVTIDVGDSTVRRVVPVVNNGVVTWTSVEVV